MIESTIFNIAEAKIVVAAFFGVLARLLKDPKKDWRLWVAEMLIGIPAAVALTSLVTHYLNLPHTVFFPHDILIGIAYLVSHSSQNIVSVVNDLLKSISKGK